MIKNKLKYWRHQKMMNQREFARFLEVHWTAVNRWELQRQQPSLEMAFHISHKLGVTIEELFEPPE